MAAPSVSAHEGQVATVVVLGEVSRSPRMRYHARSLAEHGFRVNLVGYGCIHLFRFSLHSSLLPGVLDPLAHTLPLILILPLYSTHLCTHCASSLLSSS